MPAHAHKAYVEASPQKTSPHLGAETMKKMARSMARKMRQDEHTQAAITAEIFSPLTEMLSGKGLFKFGKDMSPRMQQLTNEATEHYSRHIEQFAAFSKEAMQCHSIIDMMALNAKAMQYFCSDYVNETMTLSSKFFNQDTMAQLYGFHDANHEICEALGA